MPSPPEEPRPKAAPSALHIVPRPRTEAPTAPLEGPPSGAGAQKGDLVGGLVRTVRPHQWVKNLFVLAPMFFHKDVFTVTSTGEPALNLHVSGRAIGATAVFCLLAGAIYTINDIVDVEADRVHPVKRWRPIASGEVPAHVARAMALGLVLVSLGLAYLIDVDFLAIAAAYFVKDLLYSFKLKKVAFVDVSLIALGFVLRVWAGGIATHVHVSGYMLACTALLALFLGFGKRRHELASENATRQRAVLEAYSPASLNVALALTGGATIVTYIAYTLDPSTEAFFSSTHLWLTAPFTVFGIVRFLVLVSGRAGRGTKAESPTQEMLRDVPFVLNLVLWVVVIVAIVYRLRPSA